MLNQLKESELKEFARSIELVASRFIEGSHRSFRSGSGQEYQEHLSYSEGEDAKLIDWKRWAASDRLLVRRYQERKKSSWGILLDQSESLSFGQKAPFIKLMVGSFIYIVNVLGDQWRLDGSSAVGLQEVFAALFSEKFSGPSLINSSMEAGLDQRLIVVSDFFEDEVAIDRKLRDWQADFKSVTLLQVLDSDEIRFPFESMTEFKDLESKSKLVLDPKVMRKKYLQILENHQKHLISSLNEENLFMTIEANTDTIFKTLEELFERL